MESPSGADVVAENMEDEIAARKREARAGRDLLLYDKGILAMRKSRYAENINLIIALNVFEPQNRAEIIEF